MRYGIVRVTATLPPPEEQRAWFEAARCDVIVQEGPVSPEGRRRLDRLLFGLNAGDELLVHSLDTFQKSTGELAQLIRNFLEVGVILRIAREDHTFQPHSAGEEVLKALALLAEHETRRPSRMPGDRPRYNSGSRKPLSPYQVDYARKLYKQGVSLRAIGLLFQVPPKVVWEMVAY